MCEIHLIENQIPVRNERDERVKSGDKSVDASQLELIRELEGNRKGELPLPVPSVRVVEDFKNIPVQPEEVVAENQQKYNENCHE